MSAKQFWYATQLDHRVTHKIMMRYDSGITSDMRIVFGSRTLQIQHYRNLEERDEWLEIFAEEGAPA